MWICTKCNWDNEDFLKKCRNCGKRHDQSDIVGDEARAKFVELKKEKTEPADLDKYLEVSQPVDTIFLNEKLEEILTAQEEQTVYLKTIKNGVMFFVILTIIGMVFYFIIAISLF